MTYIKLNKDRLYCGTCNFWLGTREEFVEYFSVENKVTGICTSSCPTFSGLLMQPITNCIYWEPCQMVENKIK